MLNFEVNLFDKFEIRGNGAVLTEAEMHSEQLVKLATILINRRDTGCSSQRLIDVLWETEVSNPINALKNLIYRLRKQLMAVWPDVDLIVTGKTLYRWNTDIPMKVDTEVFNELINKAGAAGNSDEKADLLKDAVGIYRGKLLADHTESHDLLYRQIYYQNKYLDAVSELYSIYEQKSMYAEMAQLCQSAILIEPMEEKLHCMLLRAYIRENRLSVAEEHYHETVRVLADHIGTDTASELREIYEELMRQQHSRELDLANIIDDLRESGLKATAFYCEYGTFKHIYELESRRRERLDLPIAMVLISVYAENEKKLSAEETAVCENIGMRQLHDTLLGTLRHGDVITRYSNSQYLAMLTNCPEPSVPNAMERVFTAYYRDIRDKDAKIQYSFAMVE